MVDYNMWLLLFLDTFYTVFNISKPILRMNINREVWNMKLASAGQKPTKWHVRPAKTQISLGIRPGWSESSIALNG